MSFRRISSLRTALALCALHSSPSFAQMTVVLGGQVAVGTRSNGTLTVDMPDVPAGAFLADGIVSAIRTEESLQLTAYVGVTGVRITFGDRADGDLSELGRFRNKEGASSAPHTAIAMRRVGATGFTSPGQTIAWPISGSSHLKNY